MKTQGLERRESGIISGSWAGYNIIDVEMHLEHSQGNVGFLYTYIQTVLMILLVYLKLIILGHPSRMMLMKSPWSHHL